MKLLVCVKGQDFDDVFVWAKTHQAGDVIHIFDDDEPIGRIERDDPAWRLLAVHECGEAVRIQLQSFEAQTMMDDRPQPLQRRACKLDWSGITDADFLAYMADDKREAEEFALPYLIGSKHLRPIVKPRLRHPDAADDVLWL